MLRCSSIIAAVVAVAVRGQTCTYEELVSNRYTLASTPVSGWGVVDASKSLRSSGIGVVGGVPGAVLIDGNGAALIHRPDGIGSRDASNPSMTDAMYWTLPSATLPVTGVSGLTDDDLLIPGLDDSPSAGGISGALLHDIAVLDPSSVGPGYVQLNCSLTASSTVHCVAVAAASCGSTSWGRVYDYAVVETDGTTTTVFIATDSGLARAQVGGQGGPTCGWVISDPAVTASWPVRAVTAAPTASGGTRIVAGGAWKLWVVDPASGSVTHWEWATNFTSGQGGAVSDEVTSLAADWDTGVVYVGTLSALDVLYANNTLGRVDGYDGLPYSHITSLAVQASGALPLCPTGTGGQGPMAPACSSAAESTTRPTTRLLIGTDAGMSIADISPAGITSGRAKEAAVLLDPLPVSSWGWRYMFLARYLTGVAVTGVAAFGNDPSLAWPGGVDAAPAAFVAASAPYPLPPSRAAPSVSASEAATEAQAVGTPVEVFGLSWIERQPWTLELKARRMRNIQTRHNRHGLVAECDLAPAGNLSSCTSYPSDNNGLWTSLVSSAFFMEHAITGSAQALADAITFLNGLAQLNDVTGISGLMGRSCISPEEALPAGGTWYNSTAAGYEGWKWKGDTSSDEVAGQMFGFAAATQYLAGNSGSTRDANTSWTPARAAAYLINIAVYISKNGFKLIDADGSPTRWGDWSPQALNNNRSWTDERGVNALEILALLTSAIAAAPALPDKGAASLPVLTAAWAELTNATNDYPSNLRNLKIETPCDDNYSDDELTALPFYTWMTITKQLPGGDSASTADVAACLAGMDRWWGQMSGLRSDWWAAVTAGSAQARADQGVVPSFHRDEAAADARWNLETWPLEMIEWSVQNSHREDISFYQYEDRSGNTGNAATRVLPANERNQGRWNGNPHDLDSGSGGLLEMDAGVFLLPYWKGRLHGLVA